MGRRQLAELLPDPDSGGQEQCTEQPWAGSPSVGVLLPLGTGWCLLMGIP